jgi:hypothetical protein
MRLQKIHLAAVADSEPEHRPSKRNGLLRVDQEIQLRTLMPLVDYSDQIRSTGIIAPPIPPPS